ncbi:hypothetical protein KIN20_027505 [Parelaphostrongylus tenuis]|uniref:C3H1-type domain-containing protein n=1 Tax=Parelaphostrongylus tenuis TaxID=148309 RepID=A0AAD5QZF2_PARTN|nr:hypothetical protein KIN20_027505 [Parelaphostrongylus tenuis]
MIALFEECSLAIIVRLRVALNGATSFSQIVDPGFRYNVSILRVISKVLLRVILSLVRSRIELLVHSIHDSLSSPTEALSSLLDTLSSPALDNCSNFSIGQFTGSSYKQMISPNRFSQPNRRAVGIMSSHYESNNSPGAPGTPINKQVPDSSMASVNFHSSGGVTTLSNVPPPKNPKLYKTELCRSWMDHGRCNYGERCQYAHGEQEKRPIPRHPKYKTEACQSYHQTGYCPYGPRCHFIHSEADLLANLSTPPSSIRTNRNNSFIPQTCSQQLSSASFTGAPLGGNPVMNGQEHILLGSSVLQRVSSLPGYGSTGESTAGSSSSADSGSESPNGSFSPGLDLDDGGSFGAAFYGSSSSQSTRSADVKFSELRCQSNAN